MAVWHDINLVGQNVNRLAIYHAAITRATSKGDLNLPNSINFCPTKLYIAMSLLATVDSTIKLEGISHTVAIPSLI